MKVGKQAIYKIVAESLAVETKDRSSQKILAAVEAVSITLIADGHKINGKLNRKSAVRAVQKRLESYD
jgi:hypothetical protein